MKPILIRLFAALFLLALVPRAEAHAFLDHADPKVGSVVAHAPAEIRLWFTARLEPAFSSAEVRDAHDRLVSAGRAHVDARNQALLVVPVPALRPGKYTVRWRVVARDTHRTEGHFTFTVRAAPPRERRR